MIAIIVLSSIILVSILAYYSWIVKPKQIIRFYKSQFQRLGFKVFDYPFHALHYAQFQTGVKAHLNSRDMMSVVKQATSQFDVSITNLVQKVQINLISPKLMQAFYESDQDRYYRKYDFFIGALRRALGNGITLSDGNVWKHKRRVVTKMLNFSYIRSLVPKIEAITERRIQELQAQINPKGDADFREFNLLQLTTVIQSTVMLQLFFGGSQHDVHQLRINGTKITDFVRKMFDHILKQILSPLTFVLGDRFLKMGIRQNDRQLNQLIRVFRSFIHDFIWQRVQALKEHYAVEREAPEVFTDLIEAFYYEQIVKSKQDVTPAFIQSLIDDFGQLYVAGTDTTSHNSQVAIYYIISNPEVEKKLREDIKCNIKDISKLTYDDFKNCHYLQAVIMESLRMYSTANGIFPRVAIEDHYLKVGQESVKITKGTIVNTQTFPIHYKETVYSHPNQFRPERFLDGEGKIISPEPYSWMNFSAGFRSCVGKQLALTDMKTLLIVLFSNYDLKYDDSKKQLLFKEFAYKMADVIFQIRPRSALLAQ